MTTASVIIPEGLKVNSNEPISIENFLKALYLNKEDVEDFIEVQKSIKNKSSKFYNFDDIVNEY